MRFDFSGTTPLFRQVAEQISEAIVSGAFAEGEQVPSTTEISSTYAINPAREKARDAKREELLTTRVVELVAQAKALGISCEQLQRIIGRTYR